MVTRPYYVDDEHSNRRYSGRGLSYSMSQDRMLPPAEGGGSRSYHDPSQDARGNDHSSDQDPQPRRRIPVACGRCRKRKIRCSGPPENGGPCSNCRNANNDQCAFLRVSSTETPLKNEGPEFPYDPASSRRMPQSGSYSHQGYHHISPVSSDGINAYRSNSITEYPYNVKSLFPGLYHEYPEQHVDYSVHSMNQLMDYSPAHTGRSWNHNNKNSTGMMYLEQDPNYGNQLQYQTSSFFLPLRPGGNHDSKGYNLNNIISPISAHGSDRILPIPSTNRPTQVNSFVRGDGIIPASLPGSNHSSYNGMMGSNIFNGGPVKAINTPSVSESQSVPNQNASFISVSSSSGSDSDNSSPIAYSSHAHGLPLNHHHNDSGIWSSDGLYSASTSASEMSYNYAPCSSDGSRKASQSSQGGNDVSLPSLSNHIYVPLPAQPLSNHAAYPQPPMDPQTSLRRVGSVHAL